jgi:uncharacterized protein (TIGR00290 family)
MHDSLPPPRAFLSWSSGKDSAFALIEARQQGLADVVGVLTTLNSAFDRVAMHGVRRELLQRQVVALGLPVIAVDLPWPCSNEDYERLMAGAVGAVKGQGVAHMVFGDLFLGDIRAYRERQLAQVGMAAIFPLWGRDTARLAREMIDAGIVAHLVCIDPKQLPAGFAGRPFDHELLRDLPANVDPCGENGEFHTIVTDGPMFAAPIEVVPGEVVERDGFVYADFLPADAAD